MPELAKWISAIAFCLPLADCRHETQVPAAPAAVSATSATALPSEGGQTDILHSGFAGPSVIKLDFSLTRDSSQIPVDGTRGWEAEGWLSLSNRDMSIRLPNDHVYQHHFYSVQFHRINDRVVLLKMSFDEMSIDEAYPLLLRLAEDWKLSKREIMSWKSAADAGKWNRNLIPIIDNSQMPNVDIAINDSFNYMDANKPVRVILTLNWPWTEK